MAAKYGVATRRGTDLAEALARDDVDAVILCTPTQMHAAQAIACMEAGKHVQVEIPLADSWADAQAVLDAAAGDRPGRAWSATPAASTPRHQWVHNRIAAGELNDPADGRADLLLPPHQHERQGQPRSWTDHLLWHHAAHTVDLFAYQAGKIVQANAIQGPIHPELGIAMDMSIQLKSESGAICTLSLSFNNDGPLGTFFRYIGDTGTYIARYDDLVNGREEPIDVSQRRRLDERHRAAGPRVRRRDPRGPRAELAIAPGLDCYRVLGELEKQLA